MGKVLNLRDVEDTSLWKHLSSGFEDTSDSSLASDLATNVKSLCSEASDRMRAMPSQYPQFTLHDEVHLLRVTELMAMILGQTLTRLNPLEIALLILAAHLHDQGMILEEDKLSEIRDSNEFQVHCDTWKIDHPNFREIEQQMQDRNLSDSERQRLTLRLGELNYAMLADYIRKTHGDRSADFVRQRYANDKRLEVARVNLADSLALLCKSHCLPAEDLNPTNGFHHDESIGNYQINLRYLALVLRLADILDFDRDRTPDALYRTIHFTSDVSLAEWEKHRSVTGWKISPDLIRFSMRFEHPIYERTAREFLDVIDFELVSAHEIVRSFPGAFANHALDLPQRVDRSRVGPKNKAYIYHDLEFSLSRDEIVKLLMTDNLYSGPHLCVRELLQNSLDALRYRKALFKMGGIDWNEGEIDIEHSVDDNGHELIRCTDNGVGMDEGCVKKVL